MLSFATRATSLGRGFGLGRCTFFYKLRRGLRQPNVAVPRRCEALKWHHRFGRNGTADSGGSDHLVYSTFIFKLAIGKDITFTEPARRLLTAPRARQTPTLLVAVRDVARITVAGYSVTLTQPGLLPMRSSIKGVSKSTKKLFLPWTAHCSPVRLLRVLPHGAQVVETRDVTWKTMPSKPPAIATSLAGDNGAGSTTRR